MTDEIAELQSALTHHYRFDRELGRGGMAVVYLAHDLRHDRQVAIKVLAQPRPAAADDERFSREIRVAAQLNHPHILTLHDSGEAAGHHYYVMPFIAGESLRDLLTRDGALPVDEAVSIVREVAEALDYAHRAGIVHRDIKPENILLHEGHAVVADFGIARALDPSEANLTETGLVVGTPAYLSPEQITNEELDGRSDLYSLGCVLFECLTGEAPFSGTSVAAIAQRIVTAAPSVRARRPEISQQLDQALQTVMATKSEQRFSTGQEFAAALRAPAPSSPSTQTRAVSERLAIVVLPFANMSPDPDNEYFSDGLTEEIITDLSKVSALSVISRTSAMQLKGTTKDVRTIGRELGVGYVLEGSVRKAGKSLRIAAQLIDATTDDHLWADKYSGTVDDVFDLQEKVSREIVRALDVTLTHDEDRRLADHPIEDARAFELYIQARQELRRWGGAATERGMQLLSQAIEIEGETPPLKALMARAKVIQVHSGTGGDTSPLDEAEAAARSLLSVPSDAHYGHAVLGFVEWERGHMKEAVEHFEQALEQEPNDADLLFNLGISYGAAGRNDEFLATSKRLLECDPLAMLAWQLAGVVTWFVGRHEDGIPHLKRAVEMDPQNAIVRWAIGYTLACVGRVEDAAVHAAWMREHAEGMPYTGQLNALVEAQQGRKEAGREWLTDITPLDGHHMFHLAESFAMVDDTDTALDWLERGVDAGFYPYPYIAEYCPFLASLRDHPRFATIAAKAKQRAETFKTSGPY